ncbi:MAG: DUF6516 family protein [Proteobacteria bacterium]|nr:DUF6516 family protein [Pseudomonadota bacterium]
MSAVLLIRRRVVLAEDAFAEIVVWRLPKALPPSRHLFKYRLAYVVGGTCVVRYDNEQGKGDHRHYDGSESAYDFSSPETLLADFEADIRRWSHEDRRP